MLGGVVKKIDATPPAPGVAVAPLLAVENLCIEFATEEGISPAVRGVGFDLAPGRCLGIVGESGCGKSVTSLAILGLVPQPPGRIVGGRIMFEGRDLLRLPERELRALRGSSISMIFQEPMTSLNPAFTIGDQIIEAIRAHEGGSMRAAKARAIELLGHVRIPSPERRLGEYPHKLSGGMRQRVMIAMALACRPKLLIADEPTTALDVTIQAQILALLRQLREELGMAILLISHNLGVIAEVCDEVVVMYAGKVVERGSVERVFHRPEHPYTIGLLGALPRFGVDQERLVSIEGMVPDLADMPSGCSFNPRCPFADARCRGEEPVLRAIEPGHFTACLKAPLDGEA